jgi:hypothetical protein
MIEAVPMPPKPSRLKAFVRHRVTLACAAAVGIVALGFFGAWVYWSMHFWNVQRHDDRIALDWLKSYLAAQQAAVSQGAK